MANCTLFLALLSDDYLKSSNCKDELNYARNKEKNRVLIYLNDIELPAGMELRLSRLQNIHKTSYVNEESFYKKLYTSSGIEACHKRIVTDNNSTQICLYNKSTGVEMHLEYGTYLIGRNIKKCNIFVNDNKASFVHAILSVGKDVITLRDLNSTNRVAVNGKMIEPNIEFRISDKNSILVGDTELILMCKLAENGQVIQGLSDGVEILEDKKEKLIQKAELAQEMSGAYVTCSVGSKAYAYCKQNNIKNIVDIEIWKQYGKCQYCGGDISFFFRKCKNCGRLKDY